MRAVGCPECEQTIAVEDYVPDAAKIRCPYCNGERMLFEMRAPHLPIATVLELPESEEPLGAGALSAGSLAFAGATERGATSEFSLRDASASEDWSSAGTATQDVAGGSEDADEAYDLEPVASTAAAPTSGATGDKWDNLFQGPAADATTTPAVATASRARRKKQSGPNPIVLLAGIVLGGISGIAGALLALLWLPGDWARDPFEIRPLLLKHAPFLVPAGRAGDSSATAKAPTGTAPKNTAPKSNGAPKTKTATVSDPVAPSSGGANPDAPGDDDSLPTLPSDMGAGENLGTGSDMPEDSSVGGPLSLGGDDLTATPPSDFGFSDDKSPPSGGVARASDEDETPDDASSANPDEPFATPGVDSPDSPDVVSSPDEPDATEMASESPVEEPTTETPDPTESVEPAESPEPKESPNATETAEPTMPVPTTPEPLTVVDDSPEKAKAAFAKFQETMADKSSADADKQAAALGFYESLSAMGSAAPDAVTATAKEVLANRKTYVIVAGGAAARIVKPEAIGQPIAVVGKVTSVDTGPLDAQVTIQFPRKDKREVVVTMPIFLREGIELGAEIAVVGTLRDAKHVDGDRVAVVAPK